MLFGVAALLGRFLPRLGPPHKGGLFFGEGSKEIGMARAPRIALVLGGGNALGAYLAGAYEHLHKAGVQPDWIVSTSIGAVTGAILAGNAPEDRLAKLNAFWAEAMVHTSGSLSIT